MKLSKLKYRLELLRYWKALFSPFKPFHIKFYAGKTAIGTPYFFPRRWRKLNEKEVLEKAKSMIEKQIKAAAVNPDIPQLTLEQWVEKSRGFMTAVPIKVGFSSCPLGFKTKWTDTDFRYEWGPTFTFVFFGYQVAWMIGHPDPYQYWEAWLYYEYATDKTKSRKERVAQCRKEFPRTYTIYHKDPKTGENAQETIDYYERILKPKYLK